MSEFLFPSYSEWLEEHRALPWAKEYKWSNEEKWWDYITIFGILSPMLHDILSLPYQRDYYQPERAALILDTLYQRPPPILHGGTAYAVWMVKMDEIHLPTSLMGAEICRGIVKLSFIPDPAIKYVKNELKKRRYDELPSVAAEIFEQWQKSNSKIPFASWLRQAAKATF